MDTSMVWRFCGAVILKPLEKICPRHPTTPGIEKEEHTSIYPRLKQFQFSD